eukprot:GDKI01000332.1.p1 GENE.GDKI01000332.1~~GDKI01000332.1.p1  ORF type:complete len:315 (-),score=67.96 GDKI01000332.1:486-1430(-)
MSSSSTSGEAPDSPAAFLAKAQAFKATADELFQKGEFKRAILNYHHVLSHTKAMFTCSNDQMCDAINNDTENSNCPVGAKTFFPILKKLHLETLQNQAACLLQAQNYQRAVIVASESLRYGNSAKSYLHRGRCYMALNMLDFARSDLANALMLDKTDSDIHTAVSELQCVIKAFVRKEGCAFDRYFREEQGLAKANIYVQQPHHNPLLSGKKGLFASSTHAPQDPAMIEAAKQQIEQAKMIPMESVIDIHDMVAEYTQMLTYGFERIRVAPVKIKTLNNTHTHTRRCGTEHQNVSVFPHVPISTSPTHHTTPLP